MNLNLSEKHITPDSMETSSPLKNGTYMQNLMAEAGTLPGESSMGSHSTTDIESGSGTDPNLVLNEIGDVDGVAAAVQKMEDGNSSVAHQDREIPTTEEEDHGFPESHRSLGEDPMETPEPDTNSDSEVMKDYHDVDGDGDGDGSGCAGGASSAQSLQEVLEKILQCKTKCIKKDKHPLLLSFMQKREMMDKQSKKISIISSLGCSLGMRKNSKTPRRICFEYIIPYIGKVCRDCYIRLWGISYDLLKRLKKQLNDMELMPSIHKNKGKKANNVISEEVREELIQWIKQTGYEIGKREEKRTRKRKMVNEIPTRYYEKVESVAFPSHVSWSLLYQKYAMFVQAKRKDDRVISQKSFRRIINEDAVTKRFRILKN